MEGMVRARSWTRFLSFGGILIGMLFFAVSLTPSLLPRGYVLQGILSGCVFAAGYGIGAVLEWVWHYLELRPPNRKLVRALSWTAAALCVAVMIYFLWRSTAWQNSIHEVMGIPPVETVHPLRVVAIAVLPATLLILVGTAFTFGVRQVSRRLAAIIPRRVAFIGSLVIVGVLTAVLVNGVLLRGALRAADRFYADFEALVGPNEPAPADPLRSGSAASLIDWTTIGHDARVYVRSGPSADDIEAVTGRPAATPLRVYVGLRSAETAEARAELALAEMLRVGAFERSVLVLIMPVGTGWIDLPAMDTLEFLHAGDVASVALQYSHLASALSLVVEPDVGTAAAQALFEAVYRHWSALPAESRPKLYLYGSSLGAYSSQTSASLYDILADPFDGALWVGPPFASETWRWTTDRRRPDTPEWLPRFGNGATIRFVNQGGRGLDLADAEWGPLRIVYLQYPSDPIVFFDPSVLYRRPGWLDGEQRAPDVSPLLAWYPVVTFLQLALDMALSQSSPIGYGHVYAPQDYIGAWVAVTDPPGWDEDSLAELEATLARSGDRSQIEVADWFR